MATATVTPVTTTPNNLTAAAKAAAKSRSLAAKTVAAAPKPATRRRGPNKPKPAEAVKADQVATLDTATGTLEIGTAPVEKSAKERAADLAKVAAEDTPVEGIEKAEVQKVPVVKETRMSIDTGIIPGKVGMALMTPDALNALAFVSTYETVDPQSTSPRQHGYQREPMDSRYSAIGRYYAKDGNGHLITPLIVSARIYSPKDQARFNFLFNKGEIAKIHAEFGKDVFSVVDGQHRKGGLYWAWKNVEDFDVDVPVMVFYGLTFLEEAKFFDSVNAEQKKIPKALIEATLVHTQAGEKSHAQQIREIAFSLAQDGDSVWKELVNMTGSEKTKPVTFEGVRRATGNMLPDKLISRLEMRNIAPETAAKKYWELVAKACSPAWNDYARNVTDPESGETVEVPVKYRIKDLVGLAALSRLGQDILTSSLDATKTEDAFWDAVAEKVAKLGVVDWEKSPTNPWMASPAGMAGMNHLAEILFNLVYLDQKPGVSVDSE